MHTYNTVSVMYESQDYRCQRVMVPTHEYQRRRGLEVVQQRNGSLSCTRALGDERLRAAHHIDHENTECVKVLTDRMNSDYAEV